MDAGCAAASLQPRPGSLSNRVAKHPDSVDRDFHGDPGPHRQDAHRSATGDQIPQGHCHSNRGWQEETAAQPALSSSLSR
jgi:hypothetical protein